MVYELIIQIQNDTNIDAHFNGLVQDCSNSSAFAMELLQSGTKPLIYASWKKKPAKGWLPFSCLLRLPILLLFIIHPQC